MLQNQLKSTKGFYQALKNSRVRLNIPECCKTFDNVQEYSRKYINRPIKRIAGSEIFDNILECSRIHFLF